MVAADLRKRRLKPDLAPRRGLSENRRPNGFVPERLVTDDLHANVLKHPTLDQLHTLGLYGMCLLIDCVAES
jgi:hypothetical protein